MKLPQITLGKNMASNAGLISILGVIQTSGADENMKLAATMVIAVLMAAVALVAQLSPPKK